MNKPIIVVDHRERQSTVVTHLRDYHTHIKEKQLKVGDYICSDRVGAERKTVADFLQSVVDQRLFTQLQSLSTAYEKPLLLLEGNSESLFYERDIHPNTIRGVLASITIDHHIPIIWTSNPAETAAQLYWIANREQCIDKRSVAIRSAKPKSSNLQEFIISGLPSVNTVLSQRLLKKFKTIKRIANAKPEQLQNVKGIGKEKAKKIHKALTEPL